MKLARKYCIVRGNIPADNNGRHIHEDQENHREQKTIHAAAA